MEFRTPVIIDKPALQIDPLEQLLLVGSCFADHIGRKFQENKFRAAVNPFGVMYNPASILHTVQRISQPYRVVFLTLGTNHVYRLRETGEIVDNCQKRPQRLFAEEELTVDECADYLWQTVELLAARYAEVNVVLTVSPIRYQKYGFHGSQLSKATLLLAADRVVKRSEAMGESYRVTYFPAYELLMDELRDYRFYAADMIHPSEQAVDYVWELLSQYYLSAEAKEFIRQWTPIRQALEHRPFHPESAEYKDFMDKTMLKVAELQRKYPTFVL